MSAGGASPTTTAALTKTGEIITVTIDESRPGSYRACRRPHAVRVQGTNNTRDRARVKVPMRAKEIGTMKKLISLCFAASFLIIFSTADLIAAEKGTPVPKKAASVKTERSMIQTFAGRVKAVNVERKTITIAALMETEYYLAEKDTLFKEFEVDETDITFDASAAKFQGVTDISGVTKGQLVRVGYDKRGSAYIAHTVLLIPKRTSRSSVQTFLGKVVAVDPARKTMTVKATMEGEFFLQEKDTVLKELVIDERDITFNTSEATFVGNKPVKPGDTVRVGYDKKGNACTAHTVLKIEKKVK
jgi:hypothetical protein